MKGTGSAQDAAITTSLGEQSANDATLLKKDAHQEVADVEVSEVVVEAIAVEVGYVRNRCVSLDPNLIKIFSIFRAVVADHEEVVDEADVVIAADSTNHSEASTSRTLQTTKKSNSTNKFHAGI